MLGESWFFSSEEQWEISRRVKADVDQIYYLLKSFLGMGVGRWMARAVAGVAEVELPHVR